MQGKLMKLKNLGRAALATALSLAIGFGATACSRDYTVAYAYAISKSTGNIAAYSVDYQTGALTQLSGSPFASTNSGGTGAQPVVIVPSPSGRNVYVIDNNYQDISIYSVGTDGKLYGVATPSLLGAYPTSAAIDSNGCYLYVTVKSQSGTSTQLGSGAIDIFPINSSSSGCSGATADDGSLRTPTIVPVGYNPISIAVSLPFCATGLTGVTQNAACTGGGHYAVYVYVVDQENAATQAQQPEPNAASNLAPQLLGFSQNMTTGALTTLSGTTCTVPATVPATTTCIGTIGGTTTGIGTGPSSVVIDPTTRWVYVSDALSNQIYSLGIASNTTGNLTGLPSSPTASGQYPINMTIDPRGKFLLVANYNAQTVGSYAINVADGSIGAVSGTTAATVPASPTCVAIDPSLGIYVYTSNIIDGTISAEKMDANTGSLSSVVNTPFPTSVLPSCVTVVANGAHARSIVNP